MNTVPARTACSASAKPRPWASVSSRIRSMPRNPAWPSLAWKTSGCGVPVSPQYARSRPDAADAEQHLLAQAVVLVAAVEAVGDAALGRRVLLDVAVEQQQRHPADLGPPHVRVQGAALRQRHGDDRRRSRRAGAAA